MTIRQNVSAPPPPPPPPIFDKPFLEPNTALATGLVMPVAAPKDQKSGEKSIHKRDKHDKDPGPHAGSVQKVK